MKFAQKNSNTEKLSAAISAKVCGDNIFALHVSTAMSDTTVPNTTLQDDSNDNEESLSDNVVSINANAESAGVCVDGVCSISWKPKRPSAA